MFYTVPKVVNFVHAWLTVLSDMTCDRVLLIIMLFDVRLFSWFYTMYTFGCGTKPMKSRPFLRFLLGINAQIRPKRLIVGITSLVGGTWKMAVLLKMTSLFKNDILLWKWMFYMKMAVLYESDIFISK